MITASIIVAYIKGWYGAMCQGQAMSVLCRAYHATGEAKYLAAAEAALGPFTRDSRTEGGVRARFMNRCVGYHYNCFFFR